MEIILFSTKSMACQAWEPETQEEKIPVTEFEIETYDDTKLHLRWLFDFCH
jgi:hypothetical protein